MLTPQHGTTNVRQTFRTSITAICGLMLMVFTTTAAATSWVGMLSDNGGDTINIFDATTDSVRLNIAAAPGMVTGDCAVSSDQRLGVTTNSASLISFIDLQGGTAHSEPLEISNLGVDMAMSPDNRFIVTAGGGALEQPLSVISVEERQEVSTSRTFTDHTSVEFCDDGTLLVTTSNGEYYGSANGNALYDAQLDEQGAISLMGSRITSGAQPNNSACAPGSRAGVMLDRSGGLTSFTLPGLRPADSETTLGEEVVSASFSSDGRRLYVRTSTSVEAFDFDPVTGEMTPDWQREAPFSSPYFGMDQIAVHPEENKLYVDGGNALMILDTRSGEQAGAIAAADATGVCFAKVPYEAPDLMAGGNTLGITAAP